MIAFAIALMPMQNFASVDWTLSYTSNLSRCLEHAMLAGHETHAIWSTRVKESEPPRMALLAGTKAGSYTGGPAKLLGLAAG